MKKTFFIVCRHAGRPLQQRTAYQCLLHKQRRQFHISNRLNVVKPFVLADIGEGILVEL
jgi:hypothetical protein